MLPIVAGPEMNGFFGATKPPVNAEIDEPRSIEIDGACDIVSDAAGTLPIADSNENVLPEVNQDAEIVSALAVIETPYRSPDDNGTAANARVSAPAGLALLEATYQLTQQSPPLKKQDDDPRPTTAWNPFEQARKSLSKSRFDVRVIHNDGDPSNRNLV